MDGACSLLRVEALSRPNKRCCQGSLNVLVASERSPFGPMKGKNRLIWVTVSVIQLSPCS